MATIHAEKLQRACKISHVLHLDNGLLVATDGRFMTVERIDHHFTGAFTIRIDDALSEQIDQTAKYSSMIEINGDNNMRYAAAKTALGYASGNIGVFDDVQFYDRWRDVAMECAEPLTETHGNMTWAMVDLIRLCEASPSGVLHFETHHNVRDRPILVRDAATADWFGCFMGYLKDGRYHPAATLPEWMKA